jgi:galactose-1-phosphate uridylyltransferase
MRKNLKKIPKDIFVSEGFWGIYQKLDLSPDVRLDPFRTVDDSGTLIGHYSYISTLRADRPDEYFAGQDKLLYNHLEEGEDSFCRLIAGELPSIVISRDLEVTRDPLSMDPFLEDLRGTTVFTIINLFTPMARVLPPQENAFRLNRKISRGIPLLHVFSNHYQIIDTVPIDEMVLFLKNIILTIKTSQKALSKADSNLTIFHFYNIGPHAGASIPHLHCQTLIYTNGGHGWKDHSFFHSFEKNKELQGDESYCFGCELIGGMEVDPFGQRVRLEERIIWEDDYWIVFTAYAPERDGHLRLIPKRHVSALWNLEPLEIVSLAKALIYANTVLSSFIARFGDELHILPDRNILFRQQHIGFSSIHMLIDIIPVQRIGGAELLDDHRLSHIFPEETAKRMKDFAKTEIEKNTNQ